jgi:hypothetical protein
MKKFIILVLLVVSILGCAMLTSCSSSNETKISSSFPGFYFVDVSSRCVYAYIEMGSGKSSTAGIIEVYAEDGTHLRYDGELPSTSSQFVKIDAEELGLLPANIVRVDV